MTSYGFLTTNTNGLTTGGDQYTEYGHLSRHVEGANTYATNRNFHMTGFLPRYVYFPFGGNFVNLSIANELAAGNRARLNLRAHRSSSHLGNRYTNSESQIGGGWSQHIMVMYRKTDRFKMALEEIENRWDEGYQNPFYLVEDGHPVDVWQMTGQVHLDLLSKTAHVPRSYTYSGDFGVKVSETFMQPFIASIPPEDREASTFGQAGNLYNGIHLNNMGMQPDATWVNPTSFNTMTGQDIDSLAFVHAHWLRYDTATDEIIPNTEVIPSFPVFDATNAESELATAITGMESIVINRIGPQWLVRCAMGIHLDNPSSIGASYKLPLSAANTGSFKFKANFPNAADDTTFVRYVRYLRPSGLNNPLSVHRGYQMTVTADDLNTFSIYSPYVGDRPRLPLIYGDRVFTELIDPSTTQAPDTINHIHGMEHEDAITIDRTRRVQSRSYSGLDPQHWYVSPSRDDFDYCISTRDGVTYNYKIGVKDEVFTNECFTTINGVENAKIPIEFGFIVSDLQDLTARFPYVHFRYESTY